MWPEPSGADRTKTSKVNLSRSEGKRGGSSARRAIPDLKSGARAVGSDVGWTFLKMSDAEHESNGGR